MRSAKLILAVSVFLFGCVSPSLERLGDDFGRLTPFGYETIGGGFEDFDSMAYLNFAIRLQEMGEQRAVDALRSLAARPDGWRVIPLCCMVFEPRAGMSLRGPMLGEPWAFRPPQRIEGSGDLPVVLIEGVPFLVVRGYTLMGLPEPPSEYLEYCVNNAFWRQDFFARKSRDEMKSSYIAITADGRGDSESDGWHTFFRKQLRI